VIRQKYVGGLFCGTVNRKCLDNSLILDLRLKYQYKQVSKMLHVPYIINAVV